MELITEAPASGIWRADPQGEIAFDRRDTDWHTISDGSEAFYLRIATAGGYRYPGGRPGHPGDARPVPGRRSRAGRPGARLDRRHQGSVPSVPPDRAACRRPTGALRFQDALIGRGAVHFRSIEELEPGRSGPASFEDGGRTTASGSCGKARSAALVRDRRAHVAGAHAGADARVRATGRAGRRRRPGGADAVAVQAAAVPGRVLAGRLVRGTAARSSFATTTTRRPGSRA